MGQANVVGLTSIEGSLFSSLFGFQLSSRARSIEKVRCGSSDCRRIYDAMRDNIVLIARVLVLSSTPPLGA